MLSTARSLSEYYRAVQDDRTNRTLYVLTLVTSVFVPAQFLTGLYGTLATIFGTLMILLHCTALHCTICIRTLYALFQCLRSSSSHSLLCLCFVGLTLPACLVLCYTAMRPLLVSTDGFITGCATLRRPDIRISLSVSSGMNFDYMPELHWHYSYYVFWVIVVCTTTLAAAWVRGSFTSGMVANRQRLVEI